jgi:hypothetical protein
MFYSCALVRLPGGDSSVRQRCVMSVQCDLRTFAWILHTLLSLKCTSKARANPASAILVSCSAYKGFGSRGWSGLSGACFIKGSAVHELTRALGPATNAICIVGATVALTAVERGRQPGRGAGVGKNSFDKDGYFMLCWPDMYPCIGWVSLYAKVTSLSSGRRMKLLGLNLLSKQISSTCGIEKQQLLDW